MLAKLGLLLHDTSPTAIALRAALRNPDNLNLTMVLNQLEDERRLFNRLLAYCDQENHLRRGGEGDFDPDPEIEYRTLDCNVSMTVKVPVGTSDDECGSVSHEIPIELIRVDGLEGKTIEGAYVSGYTTESIEILDPEDVLD